MQKVTLFHTDRRWMFFTTFLNIFYFSMFLAFLTSFNFFSNIFTCMRRMLSQTQNFGKLCCHTTTVISIVDVTNFSCCSHSPLCTTLMGDAKSREFVYKNWDVLKTGQHLVKLWARIQWLLQNTGTVTANTNFDQPSNAVSVQKPYFHWLCRFRQQQVLT